MMKKVKLPEILVLGLSLELYHEQFPDFDKTLSRQLEKYCGEISTFSKIKKKIYALNKIRFYLLYILLKKWMITLILICFCKTMSLRARKT